MPHAIAIVHVVDPCWVVWWNNNWGWIVVDEDERKVYFALRPVGWLCTNPDCQEKLPANYAVREEDL